MFGVPSIEERIETAQRNADGYAMNLADAERQMERAKERMLDMMKRRNKELSRVGELTLLKDVRDGKLLVLDLESMEPARIAFL